MHEHQENMSVRCIVTGWLGVSGFVDEQSDGRTDGSGPLLVPFLNKVFFTL